MNARPDRLIGNWLLIICAMMFGMVAGGGHARTIGAGFIIQQWRPLTGIIPPLTHAAWLHMFNLYRQTAQFRLLRPSMTLAQFQALFMPMFIDRDWGRLMALVFALPLVWFWWRGRLSNRLALWLLALFAAGAGEATMGWLMTYQGMFGVLHPSPLYLAPHFVLAMLIFTAMLWTALTIRNPEFPIIIGHSGLRTLLSVSIGLLIATIGLGALVAATGAIHVYNTFPLMDGHALPPHAFKLRPLWLNLFANQATVQFDHRVLATITAIIVVVAAVQGLRAPLGPKPRDLFLLLAGLVIVQYILGMSALVSGMAELGYVHELNAVLLLAACVACRHALRGAVPAGAEHPLVMKAAE
ncbi:MULTISPECIES: COX15/CtaA family protein [Acidiphilium]|uniref:COX15/CtaA family protein n=2 Tax=Acidocellaceae TaxID=3385905 RepID=UPI000BD0D528|nr:MULTISPECIES: COX15/CtaA family protein [Acidiphilium]OZB27046.1 MAG: heme A synthase [Acidiphilium sp. 34-64-41]HQT85786.1 COX15/CtaA family protein [Acidiphilium rubrum]